ncbi:MAG: class I SAM-dependent methyltransferase [Candidatus Hodarchaeota archaeon]
MSRNKNLSSRNKYFIKRYFTSKRWTTYSELIRCILEINPLNILEIGPGNGLVSDILKKIGYNVKTLDIDESLCPDYNMDIRDMTFLNLKDEFDLVIASQIFEHIKYEEFLSVINRCSLFTKILIITLPHTNLNSYFFSIDVNFPLLHQRNFKFGFKIYRKKVFHDLSTWRYDIDNRHYWVIGKKGYPLKKIKKDIVKNGWLIQDNFFNLKNPKHYFFILRSKNQP